MMSDDNREATDEDLSWSRIRYWAEFGCWSALALTPFLYWLNGPATSDDQVIVRATLVAVAALGAIALRLSDLLHRHRD